MSEQGDRRPVTTPYGRLVDQATRLGMLNGLHDSLHMLLLSVERLSIEAMEGPSVEVTEGPSVEAMEGEGGGGWLFRFSKECTHGLDRSQGPTQNAVR